MTGSLAKNIHAGYRSEVLADYLFSRWGAVTPVRLQDDYGVDLYGGLAERQGRRWVIRDYYVVQVKSTTDPWVFKDKKSVRWLIDFPLPIFLSCVNKKAGTLSVYHVTSRFYVAGAGKLPPRLELEPKDLNDGTSAQWEGGEKFSLSAPILRASFDDLLDESRINALREVFTQWVRLDRENLDLLRMGLLRFRMPSIYHVNKTPSSEIEERGFARPEEEFLRQGIRTLAESVDCIGSQLGMRGDRRAALLATLLADHLKKTYSSCIKDPFWQTRVRPHLAGIACDGLNAQLPVPVKYKYAGLDAVIKHLFGHPIVDAFIKGRKPPEPA